MGLGRLISFGRMRGTVWSAQLFVVSRPSTTNGEHPVLERQPFHAAELGGIVRDKPDPEAAFVSGNEEIVGSGHLTSFLKARRPLPR
jgi:hypothetical protein